MRNSAEKSGCCDQDLSGVVAVRIQLLGRRRIAVVEFHGCDSVRDIVLKVERKLLLMGVTHE